MTAQLAHVRGEASFEPADLTIGGLLRSVATRFPERIALKQLRDVASGDQQTWTYAELLAESEACAARLLQTFQPGEHVALWAPNSARWIVFEFGALLAGLVLIPINATCRSEDLKHILIQSDAVGLFYDASAKPEETDVVMAGIGEARQRLRVVETLAEALSGATTPKAPLPTVSPQSPALIIFTSGTTGNAKGAMLSHYSLVNAHKSFEEQIDLPKGSTWMNPVPLHTIAGCGLTPLAALWNDGALLVLERFKAPEFFRAVEEDGANWAPLVPTMGIALMEHLDQHEHDLTALQAITIGGAPVSPELATELETRLEAHLLIIYGQTEACAPACQGDRRDPIAVRATSPGKTLGGREFRITDPASGATLTLGETGEICIRGFIMEGYYGQPKETAAALDSEGWLHTGDLGELHPDGSLTISGRLKDMIISGGLNVYPREVEDVLTQHTSVAEASVFGVPDKKWGEAVVAAVRPRGDATCDPDDLRAFVATRIARYKAPADIFVVDEFPLTPSGKVQKFALRDLYLSRR